MSKEKINLCLLAPVPPPYGGIGNWVMLTHDYIEKNMKNISLSMISTSPRVADTAGRTMWDRVVGSGTDMFKLTNRLKRKISAEKPDVIHITTSGQLSIIRDIKFLKLAKKHNIPSIYHIRFGRITDIARADTKEWRMFKKAAALADTIVAIDSRTAETMRGFFPDKVKLIPNPVNFEKLPEPTGVSEKKLTFLGWVIPTKGVDELLTAWEQAYKTHGDWTLEVIGPGNADYLQELRSKHTLDGVDFKGEQPHEKAMESMSVTGALVLPSYTEGFPNVVVEAMALGKAVVATDVGAIPDMLGGGCGIMVKPKETEALAKAMTEVMDNAQLRDEMGAKAREKALAEYEVGKVFEAYGKLWTAE